MKDQRLEKRFAHVPRQLAKLAMEHGYRDPEHLGNLIHGMKDGLERICSATGLSETEVLAAFGFQSRPEYTGVTLHAPCSVGGVIEPDEIETAVNARASPRIGLPDSACWISRFGPARNQGASGTCTGFTATAMLECQVGGAIDLSERFVYWGTKTIDGKPDMEGSYLRFATQWLTDYGACLEETWPYVEDRAALKERPSDEAFREAAEFTPDDRTMLPARDVGASKCELAEGRAVGFSLPIMESHYANLRFHSEGRFTLPFFMDQVVGGHAVCAVAYLDNSWLEANGFESELGGGAFLIRNSWGQDWAKSNPLAKHFGALGGYGIVPYRYIEQQCWEAVSVTCLRDARTLRSAPRGVVSLARNFASRNFERVVAGASERLYGSNKTLFPEEVS